MFGKYIFRCDVIALYGSQRNTAKVADRACASQLCRFIRPSEILKERKMQSQCMLKVVDDYIETPYKFVPDVFDFLDKVASVFVSLS